jgi:GGDEF domain-containing protein
VFGIKGRRSSARRISIFFREQAELFRANDLRVLEAGRRSGSRKPPGTMTARICHLSIVSAQEADGTPYAVCGISTDITERKGYEKQLEYLASHDVLTSLPNRRLLLDRLSQAIVSAKRHRQMCAVVFLDLDHFKFINDSLGHHVGDKLLQAVTQRLADCVRQGDTVARQGGDEFILVLGELLREEKEFSSGKVRDDERLRCELPCCCTAQTALYAKGA